MRWRADSGPTPYERRERLSFAWLPLRTTDGWPQWIWLERVVLVEEWRRDEFGGDWFLVGIHAPEHRRKE